MEDSSIASGTRVSKDVITVIEDIYLHLGVTFDKLGLDALEDARVWINQPGEGE